MTGYYLSVGYNSGAGRPEANWLALVGVFHAVLADPARIVSEVLRVEPGVKSELLTYAEWYTHPDRKAGEDCSFRIYAKPEDVGPLTDADEFTPYIAQYASGGGASRGLKERVRRAVCRLVIHDMHRRGIEVNFEVV